MRKPVKIDMRGFLSFYILWILKQRHMCGEELIREIGRRRDDAPSPGTLYPCLNKLKEKGLVSKERDDKRVVYSLTPAGIKELDLAIDYFKAVYGEIILRGDIVSSRSHSYMPTKKTASQKDELDIDYI